ncbi:LPXTG-motif cell wall anchor domain-containing protein [Salinibacillus kushneri]|uniref:LPXTG-motif cell wall anchor domain-containing protein n=1 Tax=Salinibacillus kushneri TaxID=237682 RepID=A0A1I0JH25_9BACI|nr:LPXTG cell wall anchor domain-containing protein [Salinibacillus kushneri]SEU09580.1 LPXTG-motif cell wall anchor domain-containing protein [Salinibacillus kushneri]
MKEIAKIGLGIIVLLFMLTYSVNTVFSATNSDSSIEVDIETTTNDYLFNIDNMKPGDWAPRTTTVRNLGIRDFEYKIIVEYDSGSRELFDLLRLDIHAGDKELYKGKLANLELEPRDLANGSEEDLEFTLRFPTDAGNEFQGLDTQFTITFVAENFDSVEVEGSVDGEDDGAISDNVQGASLLPKTGEDLLKFLIVGFITLSIGAGIVFYQRKKA